MQIILNFMDQRRSYIVEGMECLSLALCTCSQYSHHHNVSVFAGVQVVWLFQSYSMLGKVQKARLQYRASTKKQEDEKELGNEKVADWLDKKDQ